MTIDEMRKIADDLREQHRRARRLCAEAESRKAEAEAERVARVSEMHDYHSMWQGLRAMMQRAGGPDPGPLVP